MQNEISQSPSPLQQFSEKDIQRFWSHVNKDGTTPLHCPELGPCWIWESATRPNGYGIIKIKGRDVGAHRFHFLINGGIPDGFIACHHCDVRNCVNPSHLFLGTWKENMLDMVKKGRGVKSHHFPLETRARGESNGNSVLDASQVFTIKQLHSQGMTGVTIAIRFGIDPTSVYSILHGRTWKHVKYP